MSKQFFLVKRMRLDRATNRLLSISAGAYICNLAVYSVHLSKVDVRIHYLFSNHYNHYYIACRKKNSKIARPVVGYMFVPLGKVL